MNPTDVLKYGHLTVLRTVEDFPYDQVYTTGACGYWSVKDLVAHLASFELVLVDVLGNILESGPTPYLTEFIASHARFNDNQVDQRQDISLAGVLDEYQAAHDRVRALAARVAPEDWEREGMLPWYGAEYDLEDLVAYMYYGHKREHCGQIAVFRDRFV